MINVAKGRSNLDQVCHNLILLLRHQSAAEYKQTKSRSAYLAGSAAEAIGLRTADRF